MTSTESIAKHICRENYDFYKRFISFLTTCFSLIISYFITIHIFYRMQHVIDFFICGMTLFKISTHIFVDNISDIGNPGNSCDYANDNLVHQTEKTSDPSRPLMYDIKELRYLHKKAHKIKKQRTNYGKMLLRQIYVVSTIRTVISLLGLLDLLNYVPVVGLFTGTFLPCVRICMYLLLILVQIPTAFINTLTSNITTKLAINGKLFESLHLIRPLSEEIIDIVISVTNKTKNQLAIETIHDKLMKYESDVILDMNDYYYFLKQ